MIKGQQDLHGSESRLLSVQEAATYLGVTPCSVFRLVEQGLLTPLRLPGVRPMLFDRQNVDDMAASASQPHEYMGDDGVETPEEGP